MSHGVLWHSLSFVAVTAALLAILIGARLSFRWRLAVVAAASAAYIVHYAGLDALTGWPSRVPLDGTFDVLGARVVEPGRAGNEPGHVELWIHRDGERESRLFRLPYSDALHETASRARAGLDAGRPQRGRREPGNLGGSGGGSVRIADKPPPRLPAKPGQPSR
ncbi:MAG: hypothetical protein DWQ08_05940 [Proteobacteria bacterium]|nr:MAG: hypothetical protein DWQ08_05940 [Pseudomonadota bacterium]